MWRMLKNAAIFDSDDEAEEKTDDDEMKQGTSAKAKNRKGSFLVLNYKHRKAK